MADKKFKIEIGNHSDVGRVREINEDYFGSFQGSYGELLIVCDGMGGHKGGEIASRLSVESIKNHFEKLNNSFNPVKELKSSIQSANHTLMDAAKNDPALNDMGSTVVITLLQDDNAYTANLGDSRIYLCRDGEIKQLTKDHSLVQQMVDSRMISEEEAKHHPQKNVITRSLGIGVETEPEVSDEIKIKVGDTFILCSDGLTTFVSNSEILKIVSNGTVQDAANKLIELANKRGGEDNITVQIAKVTNSDH
ncbi:MAG: Stp1/IreP family PP2C-type Ser/Thr phosphatase [Ignavibacteria bacterium]|nr:Stp1/IreP family PP2C-type Ser/Thr phosphatase [Ignavibacteria bacterium]MBT8382748.1 Stp1/IreP family PP2C-type Ser/Thr phosphatase [Ignavibacteria bacterium]MBT8392957.1 Stp1/IreP family PP2C-type Ser/Thr phosphatase [Ignavibacteria bacterium]NNL19744.1 Stp1/IreP family PP2C-type Ser/Thr phosphatase [Ignavibacteriaceae bacterium]